AWQTRRCGRVGDRKHPGRSLGRGGGTDYSRMHMKTVANQFGGYLVALQNRPDQPRCPMAEGRHPVEKMGRQSSAISDGFLREFVAGARVPQGSAITARAQPSDEIESSVEFGCNRDNPDIGRRTFYFAENVSGCEVVVMRVRGSERL